MKKGGEQLEFKRGVVSGAKAGAVYGIIMVLIGIAYAYTQLEPGEYIAIERAITLAIGYAIAGAIVGTIFGTIYAAAYSHLPGAKSISKGIFFGIVWWIVVGMGVAYCLGTAIGIYHAVSSLILALIWGALTGFFWDRYRT